MLVLAVMVYMLKCVPMGPRPWPSWGSMLRDSQQYIYLVWWFPLIPGLAITLLVMSANLTGDWLRDRFDPTRRQL
jgi:peptide/nickel transport system permease protein